MPKISKRYRYPKNGIYVIALCVTNSCTNFEANIYILGCEMAQKPIGGNEVIFLNSIIEISYFRTTKQIIFLESLDKTEQNSCIFLKKLFTLKN